MFYSWDQIDKDKWMWYSLMRDFGWNETTIKDDKNIIKIEVKFGYMNQYYF